MVQFDSPRSLRYAHNTVPELTFEDSELAPQTNDYRAYPLILRPTPPGVRYPLLGRVQGRVTPAQTQYVTLINPGVDTLGTYANVVGAFTFLNVPSGTYTLTVQSPDTNVYPDFVRSDVAVTAGDLTDVGLLELERT